MIGQARTKTFKRDFLMPIAIEDHSARGSLDGLGGTVKAIIMAGASGVW